MVESLRKAIGISAECGERVQRATTIIHNKGGRNFQRLTQAIRVDCRCSRMGDKRKRTTLKAEINNRWVGVMQHARVAFAMHEAIIAVQRFHGQAPNLEESLGTSLLYDACS